MQRSPSREVFLRHGCVFASFQAGVAVTRGCLVSKGTTLADVARAAGYSKSTASLVFQGSPLVADHTRARILAAAQELGYVYNRRAAAMRRQRSHSIGVVVGGFGNPFFGLLSEAIERTLGPAGYSVLLGNTFDEPSRQHRLIETFLENRVDGLMIVPAVGSDVGFLEPVRRMGIPLVVLTRMVKGADAPYFGADDVLGGRMAAEHLVSHGCDGLAYFGGPADVFTRVDRHAGVSSVAREQGILFDDLWSAHTLTSSTSGYLTARDLLDAGPPPAGIVCHSDAVAIGLLRACHERGLKAGEDVRIIGFDDVEASSFVVPALTSISVEVADLGRIAAESVLRLLSGDGPPPPPATIFAPELVVRESCGTH